MTGPIVNATTPNSAGTSTPIANGTVQPFQDLFQGDTSDGEPFVIIETGLINANESTSRHVSLNRRVESVGDMRYV